MGLSQKLVVAGTAGCSALAVWTAGNRRRKLAACTSHVESASADASRASAAEASRASGRRGAVAEAAGDVGGGLEVLVHNVSHADLVLTLIEHFAHPPPQSPPHIDPSPAKPGVPKLPAEPGPPLRCLRGRPVFDQFEPCTKSILSHLARHAALPLHQVSCQSESGARYPVGIDLSFGDTVEGARMGDAVAPALMGDAVTVAQVRDPWGSFHIKGTKRDGGGGGGGGVLPPASHSHPRVTAAVLPLVAILIPDWLRVV